MIFSRSSCPTVGRSTSPSSRTNWPAATASTAPAPPRPLRPPAFVPAGPEPRAAGRPTPLANPGRSTPRPILGGPPTIIACSSTRLDNHSRRIVAGSFVRSDTTWDHFPTGARRRTLTARPPACSPQDRRHRPPSPASASASSPLSPTRTTPSGPRSSARSPFDPAPKSTFAF